MPIKVTVTGARGVALVMARLAVEIKKAGRGISPAVVKQVVNIVMVWDTKHFYAMQHQRAESKISLPQAVFTREVNYIGGQNTSIRRIEAKVIRLKPLNDTGRLFKSVSDQNSPDIRVTVTVDAISIVNLVPYMGKHITGLSMVNQNVFEMYGFGATEQQRLLERVPPPPLKGTGRVPRGKNKPFTKREGVYGLQVVGPGARDEHTKDKGLLKSNRPYYRLKNWAEARYPTIGKLPKRNWIFALPPEIVQAISEMVLLDVVERTK